MIPVQFDYIAPERLADAVQLLKVARRRLGLGWRT